MDKDKDQKVTKEWATTRGISDSVAAKLEEDEWDVTALMKNEQRFVQALCDAGEKKGRASSIWDRLSQGIISLHCHLYSSLLFSLSPPPPAR